MSKSPRGGTAVMAHRLGQDADHALPDAEQWRKLDLFPTPPWGTRALFKYVMPALQLPPRIRTVWEPAAGFGHMSTPLAEFSQMTLATDIFPYGPHLDAQIDFTKADPNTALVDWVITNPPFDHAYEFLEQALRTARKGVAFLVRLAWLESQGRYNSLWTQTPPSVVAVFTERLPMCLGGWDPKLSTATAYAWYVWTRDDQGQWPRVQTQPFFITTFLIPPGCKESLTLPTDVVLAERFVPGWISPSERKRQEKLQKQAIRLIAAE
ncbi:SAM-dependent DNA methyltransferase [Microvirga sesbaniae]|uniref:SAM-dependent DNA methyltransferase n=2 Tax=Microvirga TaxID=186650 RepID=UPI0021C973C0|nr:SAM-dependent DNA methyltransferase [Microvirga sp. HBU67692]